MLFAKSKNELYLLNVLNTGTEMNSLHGYRKKFYEFCELVCPYVVYKRLKRSGKINFAEAIH